MPPPLPRRGPALSGCLQIHRTERRPKTASSPKWDGEDRIQRVVFNAGNAKIDAALNEAEAREAGDAALAALLKRCLCTTSYQGNGDTRQPSTTVTFPARPLVVIVSGPEQYLFVTYGSSWGIGEVKNTIQNIDIPYSFNGNSLTFTHTQYIQKYTYKVFAILQP